MSCSDSRSGAAIQGYVIAPAGDIPVGTTVNISLHVNKPNPGDLYIWTWPEGKVTTNSSLSASYPSMKVGQHRIEVGLLRDGVIIEQAAISLPVVDASAGVASRVSNSMAIVIPSAVRPSAGPMPLLRVQTIPPFLPGDNNQRYEIAGTLLDADPEAYRIVIYSYAADGVYYVQPDIINAVTSVLSGGSWGTHIYPGLEYWVLVVKPTYSNPPARLTTQPHKDENIIDVLRITEKK
jgi:hypothetical protein